MSRGGGARGQSAIDLLLALGAVALVLGSGAEALRPARNARAVEAAAQFVAGRMRVLSRAAQRDGRARALVFSSQGDGEPLREALDASDDGIQRRSVAEGRDAAGPAYRLARDLPGVRLGRPPWPRIRDLPPSGGTVAPDEPAVRFGLARMAVFDPAGHATPGSLFVTDGRDALCAVVVYGATARIQVWCYQRADRTWIRR